MTKKEIVNVSTSAAEICEREFVPAMFTQWLPQLARLEATLAIKETSDGYVKRRKRQSQVVKNEFFGLFAESKSLSPFG